MCAQRRMAEADSLNSSQLKASPASHASLAQAVDLFVMTKFKKSYQVCCDVIKAAKCETEQERNHEVIEAATALGIQALAEMDQWQHTVSFITDVYGSIHLCSARIIQVCILLHAHVEEYLPCHKLVQTWLKHPDNLHNKHCAQVIRVYGQHILSPTGQFGILEKIVNGCKSMSEEEKTSLLHLPETGRYEDAKELQCTNTNQFLPNHLLSPTATFKESTFKDKKRHQLSSPDEDSERVSHNKNGFTSLIEICKNLYLSYFANFRSKWRERFLLIFMVFLAIWALIQTQSGDPVSSIGRLVVLWQGLLHRLKSSLGLL